MPVIQTNFIWKKAPNWDWQKIKPFIENAMVLASEIIVNEAKDKASGPSRPKPKTKRPRTGTIKKAKNRARKKWTEEKVREKLAVQATQIIDKEGHRLFGKTWRVRVDTGRYRQNLDQVTKWTGEDICQVAIGSGMNYAKYIEKNTANITLALISKIEAVQKKLFEILNKNLNDNIKI
jgi:hypothetical protein